ncbi:MAG: alcohol dehydrogenase catalytic domain-containing protein [Deltaproteobacteria bacterium]|nr:alcohol dehydrogenase catalytic domain-containing protein [Deltaproteobacteria bacterium]
MRAVVSRAPGELSVEEVPEPKPSAGQAVLRVLACGICGSDLHLHQHKLLPAGAIMGHEFCGEVVEAAGVLKAGERVCAIPNLSCGACERCRAGMGAYCQAQTPIGLGAPNGAFAEYVAIAAHEAVRVPSGVSIELAALTEPLAVGVHALNASRLRRGERCLVVGAGPIGLAIALWARHFGAREVIVSERAAGRRALAEKLGATRVVDPVREDLTSVLERVAPGGPDIVFEAVGARGLIEDCVNRVRFRGRVVVAGVCVGADSITPITGVMKETALQFVLAYEKDDFTYTLDMLAQERIDPAPLITDRVALDAVPAAFESLATPQGQGKVLACPTL